MNAPGAGAPALLEAVDIRFAYGNGPEVLCGVSVTVAGGEVLGVIGPNGSGKSTLLRILAGSLRSHSGAVHGRGGSLEEEHRGRSDHSDHEKLCRRAVAVVFDDSPFLDPISGQDNVRRLVSLRGHSAREAEAEVVHWLHRFGLGGRAEDPVAGYSFGMRRRLALAEAFAGDPDLLLLDEPTLGLDPEARGTLIEALREVAGAGAGAVVCSNDPGFVEAAADRVVLLNAGARVAAGSPEGMIAELGSGTILEVTLSGSWPRESVGGTRRVAGGPGGGSVGAEWVSPGAGVSGGQGRGGSWPDGVRCLADSGNVLRFTSSRRGAVLPELCAEILARGLEVADIRVHEPGLADVFSALTGVPLTSPGTYGEVPG